MNTELDYKWILLLGCWLIGFSSLEAQTTNSPEVSTLKNKLKAWDSESNLKNASVGFCLIDVSTGKVIAEKNKNLTLIPASSMKAVTTATALEMFGSSHTFETKLQYSGAFSEEDLLAGDIYITGGGDPTLGSSRISGSSDMDALLDNWVQEIKAAGINGIEGRVIADASIFEDADIPDAWNWADLGNYYGAGASGLSFNENLYYIHFKSGAVGATSTLLKTVPQIPDLTINNEVKSGTVGSGDNAYIYGAPYTYLRYVRGTIPPNRSDFKIKGSVPDPSLFCAQILTQKLEKAGVMVFDTVATTTRLMKLDGEAISNSRQLITSTKSPTLKAIIKSTNERSINLYAEHLLKHIGEGRGSTTGGAAAMLSYWQGKGINTVGMTIKDGSGLSRTNGVTAYQMAKIMAAMNKSEYFDDYYASLPIAGKTGTLRSMAKGTAAEGNVRAKSGSMSRVRSYTGYVTAGNGDLLAFSVMINNYTGHSSAVRKQCAEIMSLMASI